MAKKVYDKKIDKNTDWGGDASTGNLPVAGGRVQEFVKTTLNKKAGAFLFDEAKNSYLVFADAEDEAKYVQSGGVMGELIISEIKLADPGADFRASSLTPTNFAAAEDSDVIITYTWSSLDKDNINTGNGTLVLIVGGRTVFTGFVPQGENSIDISKYLIAGDNNIRMSITDSYSNSRTIAYVVNLVSLRISSSYDPSTINSGDITFRYTPIGSVIKTAHFLVDGVELETKEIATSGGQITQILPAQAHGTHSLVVYLSANIEGSDVRSNELYYDIISIEEGRVETLIASTIDSTTMVEFETLDIPYVVYNPSSHNSSVQLKVDGETLQDVIVDRRLQTWGFRAMKSGSMVLEITSNGVTKTINLTVTNSEVNIKPEENDLRLYLTSQNRSNQQINKAEWKYGDIEAQLTGFDFATNGWVRDSEGSMALKVSNDARVIIPRKIFEGEFRTSGKTIEFEFMATEMSDPNASIISSIFGDIVEEEINGKPTIIDRRVGFDITAQTAYFGSEQTSINTNFKENERVRLAFVVDKVANDRLVQVYINGILSGVQQYPSSDNFSQGTPQDIYIGGDGCTVMLYNIREYDNNLTQYQLLNNYIGDMDSTDKKIEVFYRNQLYDAYGNISYERALQYVPCLIIEGKLPEFKKDKRSVNIYYENLQDETKSYTSINAEIDVQGTSSQYYPRKNFKVKYKEFITSDGTHAKYKLRENSVPERTFTYKADFAESSGTHNTGLANYYEWAWRELGFRVPVQDEGYTNGVRTTVDGFPILIFHRETADSYLEFVGKYNFNNDKTEDTFGFKPGMVSWETKNNTSPRNLFEKADFESLDVNGNPDWLNDYEDRYPDNGYDNPFRIKRLTEWIISCTDNPSKFAEEVDDYFDVNSLLFFYVMTEFTAGIDQRGKNQFFTWYEEDDYGTDKCYLIFYDNDTVLGINNEGALSFGYGVEYHDRYGVGAGAANVWNAESSVLWALVEEALADRIENLYVRMRSEGIISYERLRYYLDDIHSSKWSESIYNEDGMFKYVNPLLETGNGSYLYALQGSREEHRKWWLFNRVLYMDSKYTTATHLSDYATMRLYTPPEWKGVKPNPDFTLTALGDGYARVKFGSYIIKKRLKGGTTEVIEAPKGMTFGDTETIVYGAKSLKSIGDLSDKYVGTLDTSKATNLTELLIGSTAEGYTNQNLILLTVGNNNLLTKLNIANCVNLTQTVNLTGCPAIREIEATGSRITGVELPDGGILSYLSLPGVASLTLRKQLILDNEGLKLDSYASVTTLIIEDTPNIDPFELVNKMNNLLRVRLIGLDGSSDDVSIFSKVKDLKGVGVGDETLTTSHLEGKWNLGSILKRDLEAYSKLWSDLTITSNNIITVITMTMNSDVGFNGNLSLTPYKDVEAYVIFGETEVLAPMVANVTSVVEAPDMVFDDTTVEIFWANALNLIGDLSDKYLGSLDISDGNTLESLIIGNELSDYSNPYFTELKLGLENNALEMINVANCPNLKGDLDLTYCPNIKNIKAIGSGISNIILPEVYDLTYLSLPAVTSLKLINQTELTNNNIILEGYDELTTLIIESCPKINPFEILAKTSKLDNLRVTGLNSYSKDVSGFKQASESNGLDENGEYLPVSYLEGKWEVGTILKRDLEYYSNLWGNLILSSNDILSIITMSMNSAVGFNGDLSLTPYKDTEVVVMFGETEVLAPLAMNVTSIIEAPEMEFDNTVVEIIGANALNLLGDLSDKYLGSIDTSEIDTLDELIIGNESNDYSNPYFTELILGLENDTLETINVANCPNLKGDLDLTYCPNIKSIKAIGSGISDIILPEAYDLTYLSLPVVTSLKLINQTELTDDNLKVEEYSKITNLVIENCPLVESVALFEKTSNITKLRLVGFNGMSEGTSIFRKALKIEDNYLEGTWHFDIISQFEYNLFTTKWPNLAITADITTNSLDMVISKPNSVESIPFNPNLNVTSNKTFEIDVKYGDINVLKKITNNKPTDIDAPIIEYNNTPVTVHGASLLKSLNQLYRNYLVSLDTTNINNFKELIIGSNVDGYVNANFTNLVLGDSENLDTIDLTGCVNFNQTLDLTGQPNMKVIKAKNTLITKINLNPNTKLTTLHLPESFKDVKLVNQSLLTDLSVSDINSLFVEGDIGVSIISLIDENISSLDKIRWVGINEIENLDKWVSLAKSNAQGINSDGTTCSLGDAIYGEYFVEIMDDESYELLTDMLPNLTITYTSFIKIPRRFKDAEAGRVLHEAGLIASPDEYRVDELKDIESLYGMFKDNEVITRFPELRHCTSVANIEYAFQNCVNLVEVSELPYLARELRGTFEGCTSLVNVPELSILTNNMENTFKGCSSLIEAPTIPTGVLNLYHTFAGCVNLVEAPAIPDGTTTMYNTFEGCISLTKAPELPNELVVLYGTFDGCTNLVEASTVPAKVNTMAYAFHNCTSLVDAPIITGPVSFLEAVFRGCTKLENIPGLPVQATNLYDAFRDCSSLKKPPMLRSPLTGISYAFDGCTNLVVPPLLDEGVEVKYLYSAYRDCPNLQVAPILQEGVDNLGYLLSGCSDLKEAPSIPSSTTGMYAMFDRSYSLDGVFVIRATTPPTYGNTLRGVIVVSIYVPDESVELYKNASGWVAFADKIKPLSEGAFEATGEFADPEVGRVLHEKGLIASPTHSTEEELSKITSLDNVFSGNTIITEFPELKYCISISSLTNTFSGCVNLIKPPAIPFTVTSMDSTFNGCVNLTKAPEIPWEINSLNNTFNGCNSLDGDYVLKTHIPPIYTDGLFNANIIYVPDELVDIYKSADGWNVFADKIKGVSETPWDYTIADPEVGRVLHENGLIASPTHSTFEELGAITSLDRVFNQNKEIVKFPELKYCTSVTSLVSAFEYSSILGSPTIPESVTNLRRAFCGSILQYAPEIPEGVTNMRETFRATYYFNGIYVVKPITPPEYWYTFEPDRTVVIYVPDESVEDYKTATGWIEVADKIKPMSEKP